MRDTIKEGKLKVKIFPGAKQNRFKAVRDGVLYIDIKAVPEDGKANKELIKFLKKEWGILFEIKTGFSSRNKLLVIPLLPRP